MNGMDSAALDAHITGNGGEDQFAGDTMNELANKVYDVLVEEAGATEEGSTGRTMFLNSWPITEYRFCGALGGGGKIRYQNGWPNLRTQRRERWYVTCYSEDETPERREIIERTNKRLAELVES
jgi:hypothetical protein